jgi:hypothetical protein
MQSIDSPQADLDPRPALSLVNQPAALEQQFVEEMNPRVPKGFLRRVTWSEIGPSVTIPAWRSSIKKYGAPFVEKSIASLPELAKRLPEIGEKLPNPKGMLLDKRQRGERPISLLVAAVGLALVEHDWCLEAKLGKFHVYRGIEQLNVPIFVSELVSGKMSPENWLQKCRDLGIVDIPLINSLQESPCPPNW